MKHWASAVLGVLVCTPIATPRASPSAASYADEAFDRRLSEAGDDVDRLWELYGWCETGSRQREGRLVLRRILELEPNHKPANEASGHVYHDGRWFTNERELAQYRAAQEERDAAQQGLARFKGEWVPTEDLPYLERGYVRDPDGVWVTSKELKLLEKGWVRQDLELVPPTDAPKIDAGLWLCGKSWETLEAANEYHAHSDRPWRIPGVHFAIESTCERGVALEALTHIERTAFELTRIYGRAPFGRVSVVVFRDAWQYELWTGGHEPTDAPPMESGSVGNVFYATLADLAFDPEASEPRVPGAAYWSDENEEGRRFGRHAVRHASGLAWGDALDPSPAALEDWAKAKPKKGKRTRGPSRAQQHAAFWSEKRLPKWFHYGAAGYVERYFVDETTPLDGNPYWSREWSLDNLKRRGGLRPLAAVLDNARVAQDPADLKDWLIEVGLVVSFILDGGVPAVRDAHQALRATIAAGGDPRADLERLEAVLFAHETDLRAYAEG